MRLLRKKNPRNKGFFLYIAAMLWIIYIIESIIPTVRDFLVINSRTIYINPWTFFTSLFPHSSSLHLVNNTIPLLLFGFFVEQIAGYDIFIKIFFITGFVGNVAAILYYPGSNINGASGAVNGLVGYITGLNPFIFVYWGFPMPVFLLALIWLTIDLSGIIVIDDNIGHAAHIAGLIAGFIIGIYHRRIYGIEGKKSHFDRESLRPEEERYIEEWEEKYLV